MTEQFELKPMSQLDAVLAYQGGTIQSVFYTSETVSVESIADHCRRAGLAGVHGVVV